MSLMNQERALSFLRLPLTAKRRRVRPVLALLTRLARWTLVAGAVAGGAAWMLTSPVFALKGFEIDAGDRVSAGWVQTRLAPFTERNLLRLDLVEVRSQLAQHAWVRGVELKKRLPDHLWVRIVEHRPLAVLRSGDALHYLDADGRVITRTDEAGGWLVVDAAGPSGAADAAREALASRSRQRALQLAALIEGEALDVGAAPAGSGRLTGISILGEDDYRLHIEGLPYALLVRSGNAQQRLELFARLRDQLARELEEWDALEAVDLRFSGRFVLRPTAVDDAAGRTSEG